MNDILEIRAGDVLSARPEIAMLGDLADFINGDRGKNYPSQGDFVEQGVPFINAGHLTDGVVDFSSMNYITDSHYNRLGSGKVQSGDILFCLRGSVGKCAVYDAASPAAIASSLVIIRPKVACDVRFLYRYLISSAASRQISHFNNGSSQPNLSAQNLKQVLIPFPSISEQKRIAAILDRGDNIRQRYQTAILLTDQLLKSVVFQFLNASKYSQDQRTIPLENIATISCGFAYKSAWFCRKGRPLIRIGDIQDGSITGNSCVHIEEACVPSGNLAVAQTGDILMALSGATTGKIGIVDERWSGSLVNQRIAVIRPYSKDLGVILANWLPLQSVQRELLKSAAGSAQANLSPRDLLSLPVPQLQSDAVHAGAEILRVGQQTKDRQRAALALASSLYQALDREMFCSRLDRQRGECQYEEALHVL